MRFDRTCPTKPLGGGILLESQLQCADRHKAGYAFQFSGRKGIFYYPAQYTPHTSQARLSRLVLDGWHPEYADICDMFEYALVHMTDNAFPVLARQIADDAIAYAPNEVERWYRTRAACEDERSRASRLLETDRHLAHTLGIHAPFAGHGEHCEN